MPEPTTKYLDPAALAKLKNLGLAARLVVEGLYSGQHRSPLKGFSVEFADHREYTAGADPRHLDWKILGKQDKLYIKQYEEQTNLRCYILVDSSKSMAYRHTGALSKFEYACYCAASLAYLMQTQHDAFGLVTFDKTLVKMLPPRQGRSHLRALNDQLEQTQPNGETDIPAAFTQLAQTLKRRALVVVLSDLFSIGETRRLLDAVALFRHKKHEVIVLHTLDRAELTFPFEDATEIEDIETSHVIAADAQAIKAQYLRKINEFITSLRTGLTSQGAGFALADTSEPFDDFLAAYLARRMSIGG